MSSFTLRLVEPHLEARSKSRRSSVTIVGVSDVSERGAIVRRGAWRSCIKAKLEEVGSRRWKKEERREERKAKDFSTVVERWKSLRYRTKVPALNPDMIQASDKEALSIRNANLCPATNFGGRKDSSQIPSFQSSTARSTVNDPPNKE